MSKKLIAVAAASALALSALVAAPAQAATISTKINNGVVAADKHAKADDAFIITDAMESGTLDYSAGHTGTVARFDVTTGAATTLTITTTGGVKVTETIKDSADEPLKIGAGSATLAKNTTSAALTYSFYAYTNSTTAGSVVVDSGSAKVTYFIKAKPGKPQNLVDVKFPVSVLSGEGTDITKNKNLITFQVTDAFGNKLTTGATVVVTTTGATPGPNAVYNNATAKKRWETYVSGDTQSSVSMQLKLDVTGADLTGAGFPATKDVAFSTVSAGSLADQVKALTAQVATLQAALAATVTKAKFNKLAKRWNRANPSNKVKLVK